MAHGSGDHKKNKSYQGRHVKHTHKYVVTKQEAKVDKDTGNVVYYVFSECREKVGTCDKRDKMEIVRNGRS